MGISKTNLLYKLWIPLSQRKSFILVIFQFEFQMTRLSLWLSLATFCLSQKQWIQPLISLAHAVPLLMEALLHQQSVLADHLEFGPSIHPLLPSQNTATEMSSAGDAISDTLNALFPKVFFYFGIVHKIIK